MRTALLLLAFVAAPALAAQTVWKWVDDRGVTHYSDRPAPGATPVEIMGRSRSNASAAPPAAAAPNAPASPEPATGPYRNFEILKPADGESFINTGGLVTVNVRIDPAVKPAHDLLLYLNGRLVEGFPQDALTYDLKDVPRGLHRVLAIVNDERGVKVQETAPVTFMVRQESIANPPVGPALRPPPKPQPGGAANKLLTQQPSYATLNGAQSSMHPAANTPVRPQTSAKPGPK